MVKYKANVLNPGVQRREDSEDIEYTESSLREALDTLDGSIVYRKSAHRDGENAIGEVIDSTYNDGVQCTVEIHDEGISKHIDEGSISIVPTMAIDLESDGETEIFFRHLFTTMFPSELVGETERVEDKWLYGWENE